MHVIYRYYFSNVVVIVGCGVNFEFCSLALICGNVQTVDSPFGLLLGQEKVREYYSLSGKFVKDFRSHRN